MTFTVFFDWWRAQLGELLPASLRNLFDGRQGQVAITIDGDKVELSSQAGKADAELDLAGDIVSAPVMKTFLNDLAGLPCRIRLSLAPGEFLIRQTTLPNAARPHLAETLRYQLPQITPFSTEHCWFACGETRGSSTQDTFTAWLLVIPRNKLARVFDAMRLSAPQSPWPCDVMPSSDQTLELVWRAVDERAPSRKRLRIAWAAMAMLWIGALMLHVDHKRQVHERLEQTANALRIEAFEVGRHRDRLAAIQAQAEWLTKEKQTAFSTLTMLDLLTQRLDDKTWLQRCELNSKRIVLTGVASSPASLIGELEALPMLSEVRFETAITRDAGNDGNRFKLSAKMTPVNTGDGI